MNTNANFTLRTVKSFVSRKGRMTAAQHMALRDLWHKYGIDCYHRQLLNLEAIFPKKTSIVLEIGFGNGQTLLQMARQYPEVNFLGIEVYQTGIARLLMDIHAEQLVNIRIMRGDAVEILRDYIKDRTINIVQLFFPDPWQKARHHKRRIVQPDFITLVANKLLTNGTFHFVTDWADYARHTLEIMEGNAEFIKLENITSGMHILTRGITKFEQRGQLLGHDIYEFAFQRR